MSMMDTLGLDEDTPIDARILSNAVENAQRAVESRHFRSRKSVLDYDNVMNTQRETIYAQRRRVLDGEDLHDSIMRMLEENIHIVVTEHLSQTGGVATDDSIRAVLAQLQGIYFPRGAYQIPQQMPDAETLAEELHALALRTYERKEAQYTPAVMRELERVVMLRVVDEYWMDHIDAMDDLRQGIGLQSYGQHDPVVAYQRESFDIFETMRMAMREETVRRLFQVQLQPSQEVQRVRVAKELSATGSGDKTVKPQPVRNADKKVGPNDPCPCGSGKKYKKCCMQKDKMGS